MSNKHNSFSESRRVRLSPPRLSEFLSFRQIKHQRGGRRRLFEFRPVNITPSADAFQVVFSESSAPTARRGSGTGAIFAGCRRQTGDGFSTDLETASAPARENRHVHRRRRLHVRRGSAREVPHRAGSVLVPLQTRLQSTEAPGPVPQ